MVNVPVCVGVPLIVPPGLSVRPAGKAVSADHEYGPMPPFAVSGCEYELPWAAGVRLPDGMLSVEPLITMVTGTLICAPTLSVTTTVNVNEPLCVGVPVIEPDGSR